MADTFDTRGVSLSFKHSEKSHPPRGIEHAIGKVPLVIKPHQKLEQASVADASLGGIDNARTGVVIKINGGMSFKGNA